MCFANTAFVATHLSNSVIVGGEEKRRTSDFLVLRRRRAANAFCGVYFCFLTDFFFIYKVVGVFFPSLELF